MNQQSAAEFPGNSRIHIGLAVRDIERARVFYEILLGQAPTKERADYVKFESHDPAVNLTLNQVDSSPSAARPATHYGVQVKSVAAVQEASARLANAGLSTSVEENTTCCYAVQDKVWVSDPDGNSWEVFVVTQADAEQRKDDTSACCATEPAGRASGSCC